MSHAAVGIAYLDGVRLRRSLLAAADWVDAWREELNRINVFPVPDGDTGTNFAMTLRATAEAVRALETAKLPVVTKAMAEACVFGARGNSGMLLSQFLLGFREALGDLETAAPEDVARAMRRGAERLYRSLDEPVEGTILTVSRDVATAAEWAAERTTNLQEMMHHVLARGEVSLRRTPELLAVLKESGVVDAGAKAFIRVLEGVVRLMEGDPILPATEPIAYTVPDAAALAEVAAERDYGYCTEVLVRGSNFPPSIEIRTQLRRLGGSIVVLATDDLLKVHVHTDAPHQVFDLAATWGAIETTKADDIREQHRALHAARRRIAIVVDSSCDLPDRLLDVHGMVVVPLQVIAGERTYADRVDIQGEELYRRMQEGGEIFTTSQPPPGAFVNAFQDACSSADEVLGLFIAGQLSGTLASAQAATQACSQGNSVTIVDSRSASYGLGMLALRAVELVDAGWSVAEIVRELNRVRDQSGGFFTVDTFENLLRSGRVSRGRAWLGGLLHIKPILEVTPEGRIAPLDRVRGRDALVPRVLEHLDRRLTPRPAVLRLGVAHAGVPELAQALKEELVRGYSPRECHVSEVTAALGVHTGPGAWGIFYQVEDAAPSEAAEQFAAELDTTR
ncbi:MAG: DegV family EDD domain-containing protein [Gemmatimonadales bacterium]|nr:DegV family EDD domain-containing protein [Gemmatimonadales bacterium]NIN12333.1 DegV family EDD domain-containing protein [Gemmatimonadales bacterium]NIN48871.1 DegV family EDD domain-containing protein [Gemmatimonadales bacterium]NIP06335.1 DegV family EDD domain-containing protein [Gemmatimonadales bacterium]NIR00707.1 DegV family EDD domain-containing protein [Gemmatimonadales bacterium]